MQNPSQNKHKPPEPKPYEVPRESRWQRIEIIPGIELHVREHLMKRYKENIKKAVVEITDIFKRTI